tara:strand:+ start:13 stop:141 length:129 start_codon:yes stop_codon:yes gene_type:complete
MKSEEQRIKYQLELLNDIIDNRLTREQLRSKRDYYSNELNKL